MTAIAAVHTSEGFVVGADGLRQSTLGQMLDGQKLFSFESRDICLGYAWCGHTVVWDDDNPSLIFFDFRAATEPILKLVALSDYVDFEGFVHNFRTILAVQITSSTLQGRDWVADCDKKIARMLLIGYLQGEPFLAQVKVEKIKSEACVSFGLLVLPKTLIAFSGCESVTAENGLDRLPKSPEDARLLIHEYIKRCVDDPNCRGYGGTVHVAKITPDAFIWMNGPAS
jgi:hypothetical protein